MASTPSPGQACTPPGTASSKRRNLTSRACDACRARRRKCDLSTGASPSDGADGCMSCTKLGIKCSFNIPSRPRGPKPKRNLRKKQVSLVVEAQVSSPASEAEHHDKTVRSAPVPLHHERDASTPTTRREGSTLHSPSLFVTATTTVPFPYPLPESGAHDRLYQRYPTDEICSREALVAIMQDFIDLVCPLIPVVHLPTFRRNLEADKDVHDTNFLSLLVALVAVTVGLLHSKFAAYRCLDTAFAGRFSTRDTLISYCVQMCLRLRSPNYWDEVSHCQWATSYILSIAVFQMGRANQSRMLEAEALQLARVLGFHKLSTYEGLNLIETQLRKKAFWLQFYTFAHTKIQLGKRNHVPYLDSFILKDLDFAALEPVNVVDEQIFERHYTNTNTTLLPKDLQSLATSANDSDFNLVSTFIVNSRIFLKGIQESIHADSCLCGCVHQPGERFARLESLYAELKYSLDGLPSYMRPWSSGIGRSFGPHWEQMDTFTTSAAQRSRHGEDMLAGAANNDGTQFEIARANIHITHLWLQSYILDRMELALPETETGTPASSASQTANDNRIEMIWKEREDVCRQLLYLLHGISQPCLEPNGHYVIYKVRAVATSLLSCPFPPGSPVATRALSYAQEFSTILSLLDHSETVNTDALETWIDRDRQLASQQQNINS